MSALELVQLMMSSGVLAGGAGLLRWAISVERRLTLLELKNKVKVG